MAIIETQNYDHLSPTELKAVKEAAREAAKSLMRSDAEKDLRNDIAAKTKDEYGISKSDFNDLTTRYHRQDKASVTAKRENQNALFDKVFPDSLVADEDETEDDNE